MTVFIDTSVWSLALRRDAALDAPQVVALRNAIENDDIIVTAGIIIQELLQGFRGPKARDQIIQRFAALPILNPDLEDHIAAADIRNVCRRAGVQLGTIDALIARLCIRHDLLLLTTDKDFAHAAKHIPLRIWTPNG